MPAVAGQAVTRSCGRLVAVLGLVLVAAAPASACELCDGPGSEFVSLQKHVETWPVVTLGKPVGRTPEGAVEVEVTEVLKGKAHVAVGRRLVVEKTVAVLPGRIWLVLGTVADPASGEILMLRPTTLAFLRAIPSLPPADDVGPRLRAFVPWLTHEDPMVSASARKAFADAPYEAVEAAARDVSVDALVPVLANPRRSASSRGAMFLLLGLAGRRAERKLLAQWMADRTSQHAAGYDALLAAWIMQTGPRGLVAIERLLRDPRTETRIVGTAYVRALGFHGRNGAALTRERIRAALRTLLDQPSAYGPAVHELRKLEAWEDTEAVLAACERNRKFAPWVLGPTLSFLEAQDSDEARALHAELEASVLDAAGTPAPDRK